MVKLAALAQRRKKHQRARNALKRMVAVRLTALMQIAEMVTTCQSRKREMTRMLLMTMS